MSDKSFDSYSDIEVIVLGAGPAGLSACLAAVEAEKRVLLIDQGKGYLNYFSTDDHYPLDQAVGGIGGTAKAWGAQCGTFSEIDERDWLSSVGTRTFNEIEKGISRMGSYLKLPIRKHNAYMFLERKLRKSLDSDRSFGLAHTIYSQSKNFKVIFSKLINSYFFNYIEGTVLKLSTDNGTQIKQIVLTDGKTLDVAKKKVVVALGAIATTRLIQNTSLPSIKVNAEVLDHPQAYVMNINGYIPWIYRKNIYFKSGNSHFKRKITYFEDGRQIIFELHTDIGNLRKFFSLLRYNVGATRLILHYIVNYIGLKFLRTTLTSECKHSIWIQTNQLPINTMRGEQDCLQPLNWSLDSNTLLFIKHSARKYAEFLTSIGVEGIELLSTERILESLSHSFHPSGTLELSNSVSGQLARQLGRIDSQSNFIVTSSALFPHSGWINPTLIIMGFSYAATKVLVSGSGHSS